jgi:hypothetical protein
LAVRVHITRHGGIAGLKLSADVATTDLDAEKAGRAEQAVTRLLDEPATASPPQPDRFRYEITVPERGASVTVNEQDVPDDLRPLIELASKAAASDSDRSRSD